MDSAACSSRPSAHQFMGEVSNREGGRRSSQLADWEAPQTMAMSWHAHLHKFSLLFVCVRNKCVQVYPIAGAVIKERGRARYLVNALAVAAAIAAATAITSHPVASIQGSSY